MKTKNEVKFLHNVVTGHFTFYTGQNIKSYEHIVIIPKGTRVTNKTALGIDENYYFVDEISFLPLIDGVKQYGVIHDLMFHGANVPKIYIEF